MNDPAISLMSVMLLLGSAQGLFLLFALLRNRKGNLSANKWLACLLLTLSLGLLDGFMNETNYYFRFPHLIGIEWPTNLAYGPFIYLYVQSLTKMGPQAVRWRQSAHFIPVMAFYVYLIPLFSLKADQKALWWLQSRTAPTADPVFYLDPIIVLIVVQQIVYLVFSMRLLVRHASRIRENFSAVEAIGLFWLRNLLIAFFILWGMYIFTFIFSGFFGIYDEAEYVIHLMVACVIYIMGFKGLAHPEIFTAMSPMPPDTESEPACLGMKKTESQRNEPTKDVLNRKEGKYKKSSLTDEQAELILSRLFGLMDKEKPYLEMGLSLAELSGRLCVSPNHLSQVINGKLGKSFFDFVNGYRVEEAKRLLVSPLARRLSILGIGMEAGFSSKSAFYTAFKKLTGASPSRFKAQNQDSGDLIR